MFIKNENFKKAGGLSKCELKECFVKKNLECCLKFWDGHKFKMSDPGSLVNFFLLEIVPFNERPTHPKMISGVSAFREPVFFSNSLKFGPLKNVETDAVIYHVMQFFHFVNFI